MPQKIHRKPSRKSIVKTTNSFHRTDESNSNEERYRQSHSTNIKRRVDTTRQKGSERGRIVGSRGRVWLVVNDANLTNFSLQTGEFTTIVHCLIGGVLLSSNSHGTLSALGDYVWYLPDSDDSSKGTILEVEQRTTYLSRKMVGNSRSAQVLVANIDHVCIVMSAADPWYNKRTIDRYLIACELGNVQPTIVINKIELMPESFVKSDLAIYNELGIDVIVTSVYKHIGIDELQRLTSERSSVFVGPSGVGKSSLVNALFGIELQEVGEVSAKYLKGTHTTSASRLFALKNGGFLADTPGIREFGVIDIHPDEISFYFHDFDAVYSDCKYLPCTHTHEPQCAVKLAVENGIINAERYESYMRIRESLLSENTR